MEKQYTKEQTEIIGIIQSWEKTEFWKFITKQLLIEIKETEDILCWRKKTVDPEDRTKICNLDEVKYSMNWLLREKLRVLNDLLEYPDKVKKSLWILQIDNNTPK